MRYNLLDMVQRILESMDSDEVNSHTDTTESLAVANIVRESYYHIAPKIEIPTNHTFFQLDASGDSTKPCLMTVPSDVIDLDYIKYKHTNAASDAVFDYVEFLSIEEFMTKTLSLAESDSTVSTMNVSLDGTTFLFKFKTDHKPTFYTAIDNHTLIFNSYDSTESSTLVAANTLCYGQKVPTFTMSDTFVPSLEPDQFDYLLNEAKTQAHAELKQVDAPVSRRRAKQGFIQVQRTKANTPVQTQQRRPNYGRKV
jgi:hypothetical protein